MCYLFKSTCTLYVCTHVTSNYFRAIVGEFVKSPTPKCNYWGPSLWGANFIKLLKVKTI
jgi:hypothetical protein